MIGIELTPTGIIVVAITTLIVVAIVLVILWKKLRSWGRKSLYAEQDRSLIRKKWQEVEKMRARGDEQSLKMAVLEADKLLDHTLKSMVMPGTTLGERLKVATARYPDIKNVWWAHKLRNDLVHEASKDISARNLHAALDEFRKALTKLGAL